MSQKRNDLPASANNDDVVTIDLAEVFRTIGHNIGFILIITILAGGIALGITFLFIHPTYRTSFVAYINNRTVTSNTDALSSGDTSAAQSLTYTYASILTGRTVVEEAAESAGLSSEYTYEDLEQMVSTNIESQTQLIDVFVTMPDPGEAYRMANAMAAIAPDYVSDIVEGSSMKVAEMPVYPDKKYSPSNSRNLAVGAVIGFLLATVFVVIRGLNDRRIKSEEDLKERFGLPVIGTIPDILAASTSASSYAYYAGSSGSKRSGKSTAAGRGNGRTDKKRSEDKKRTSGGGK